MHGCGLGPDMRDELLKLHEGDDIFKNDNGWPEQKDEFEHGM